MTLNFLFSKTSEREEVVKHDKKSQLNYKLEHREYKI